MGIDLGRRALFDNLTGIHHDHTVRNLGHHPQIMGDDQQGHSRLALQLLQKGQDLRLHSDIERRGRLIGDQHIGPQRQRHGDHQPLPLPARELMRIFLRRRRRILNADLFQQGQRFTLGIGARGAMHHQRLLNLPADGVDRVQMAQRILKDHRNPLAVDRAPLRGAHLQQIAPLEQDRAIGDFARRAIDQIHHRRGRNRLPRPGFPQDRQHLAAVDRPADMAHRLHRPARGVKGDRQVADFQQRFRHVSCLPFPDASAGSGPMPRAASSTRD